MSRYDNRKSGGSDDGKHWSDEKVFSTRVLFAPASSRSVLALDELKLSDDGIYKCRVDFKLARTSITRIKLSVIGNNKFIKDNSITITCNLCCIVNLNLN